MIGDSRPTIKARLAEGEKLIGAFVLMPSADVVEVLSYSKLDFLLIDHEHGLGGRSDGVAQMRSLKGSHVAGMFRVPANDPTYVKRMLDAGAQNLLCPNVQSAEEAAAFVRACRYPPRGLRGAGGGIRAAGFGFDMGYYEPAAEDVRLLAVQIETMAGIDNIAEIAAVDGVDLVVIGPRDLSADMGVLNRFDDPALLAAVSLAEKGIIRSGKHLASVIYPGRTAADMFASGYDLLILGADVAFLANGVEAACRAAGR